MNKVLVVSLCMLFVTGSVCGSDAFPQSVTLGQKIISAYKEALSYALQRAKALKGNKPPYKGLKRHTLRLNVAEKTVILKRFLPIVTKGTRAEKTQQLYQPLQKDYADFAIREINFNYSVQEQKLVNEIDTTLHDKMPLTRKLNELKVAQASFKAAAKNGMANKSYEEVLDLAQSAGQPYNIYFSIPRAPAQNK